MAEIDVQPWRVSLHGGHSGEYCDHAEGALRDLLTAAVAAGYHTFGVSEHAPRSESRFLYSEERAMGWDVAKLQADFNRYTHALPELVAEFADRLIVLRGFEAEVVPTATYAEQMPGIRCETLADGSPAFDYFVGSVHYVNECQIDGRPKNYLKAMEASGGLENLACRYYETVAEMITTLRPDVAGHLDLMKKNVRAVGENLLLLETPRVRQAAENALEAAKANGCILDLNLAGWRKGLGEPYPAPWLVERARDMGVPFCFGDDSHRISDVGEGLEAGREYLLQQGVTTVTVLTRDGDRATGPIVRRVVPL